MKKQISGYITLYLALTIGIMLTLVFLLLEGVRDQTIRTEAEGVMDIALFSVFGEYHRQLLEQYDLFYIDTSYGEGSPSIVRSEEHLQYYMNENFQKETVSGFLGYRDLTALSCDNVSFEEYVRPNDGKGRVLKGQIADYMKSKNLLGVSETLLSNLNVLNSNGCFTRDVEEEWSQVQQEIQALEEEKRKELWDEYEAKEEEPPKLDNPADHVMGIKTEGILGLALPSGKTVSAMEIHNSYYFSHRNPLQGKGNIDSSGGLLHDIAERLTLQEYFFEKCSYYSEIMDKAVLKYQLEYLIYGEDSDLKNLEQTMEDILHIREVINLAYLLSDSGKMEEADLLAYLVSVLLFSPELKEAVKMSIIFAWSYAESVKDVRILLDGGRVPLLKDSENWNTPLSRLLSFTSHLGEYKESPDGMNYRDFLEVFLYRKPEEELLYRFMDICEMDIRITPGNSYFQMDGCIDAVRAKANISSGYGYGYEITRKYKYE